MSEISPNKNKPLSDGENFEQSVVDEEATTAYLYDLVNSNHPLPVYDHRKYTGSSLRPNSRLIKRPIVKRVSNPNSASREDHPDQSIRLESKGAPISSKFSRLHFNSSS